MGSGTSRATSSAEGSYLGRAGRQGEGAAPGRQRVRAWRSMACRAAGPRGPPRMLLCAAAVRRACPGPAACAGMPGRRRRPPKVVQQALVPLHVVGERGAQLVGRLQAAPGEGRCARARPSQQLRSPWAAAATAVCRRIPCKRVTEAAARSMRASQQGTCARVLMPGLCMLAQ